MPGRRASSRLFWPTKAQIARDGETKETKTKLTRRGSSTSSSSQATPTHSPKHEMGIVKTSYAASPKSQAKNPEGKLAQCQRLPDNQSKIPSRRPPKQPESTALSGAENNRSMSRNQLYVSSESSFENSLESKYTLSNSIHLNYSPSGSLHKIDDSNTKSTSTGSLFGTKLEQEVTKDARKEAICKNNRNQIQCKDEIFEKHELMPPTHTYEDPNLELPMKAPLSSTNNDTRSVVSALTFDYANLEIYGTHLDVPELENVVSIHKQIREQTKWDKNKLSWQGPRKSERLYAVHDKVIDLQTENMELKKTNSQLVTQMKIWREMEKQNRLKNALRLNTIAKKVASIQAGNQSLQEVNESLLLRIDELESEQAANITRGSSDEELFLNIFPNSNLSDAEQLGLKKKIADLVLNNSQQRLRTEELNRELKERDISETNLEQHIELLNDEMIASRQDHDDEKEELNTAYNELKREASQIVDWLKKQLIDYQSKHRAEEIAKAREDDDLESLTKSERESLVKEIEEERQNWIGDLGGSPSCLNFVMPSRSEDLEVSIICDSDSIDGSTITGPL